MTTIVRDQIFISYSHLDQKRVNWLEKLQRYLKVFKQLDVWDDRRIPPGSEWREQIVQAINRAKVAVLLVGPGFLGSDFITTHELPPLLNAAKLEGVKIFPLVIGYCPYRQSELEPFQAFNDPDMPLEALRGHEQNRILNDISIAIGKALNEDSQLSVQKDNDGLKFAEYINFPFPKRYNKFFEGRDDIFEQITEKFKRDNLAILSGLGGIGKTSIAIEYANKHNSDYKIILWMSANSEDSEKFLKSSFDDIAKRLLKVERQDNTENNIRIVQNWLRNNRDWLLIIDDIEKVDLIYEYFTFEMPGHLLVTSREPATGSIPIDVLPLEESIKFIIKRSNVTSNENNLADAGSLCEELGRLSLALEQAGAYIEKTKCGLSNYLKIFREEKAIRIKLLKEGIYPTSWHKEAVTTTWTVSLRKIQQLKPVALEILNICALLHFEISEEIITEGSKNLGKNIQLLVDNFIEYNDALEKLLSYSLIQRNPDTRKIIIHKLLQEVLRSEMEVEIRVKNLERIIRALNHIFPEPDFSNWNKCNRLINHVQTIIEQVKPLKIEVVEFAQLLNKAGIYLFYRARFNEAEEIFKYALSEIAVAESNEFARLSNSFAELLESEGRYEESLEQADKARKIWEKLFGTKSLEYADGDKTLGMIYESTGKAQEAINLFEYALEVRRCLLGDEHIKVAEIYNYLGKIYSMIGEFEKSLSFHEKARSIREKKLIQGHPDVAETYNNIATVYVKINKYEAAEDFYKKALDICENYSNSTGQTIKKHPDIVFPLNNLAVCHINQGKYDEAENLLRESISILESNYGSMHPDLATTINNLGLLYYTKCDYNKAIELYQKALDTWKKIHGEKHSDIVIALTNLGLAHLMQKDYPDAKDYLQQALNMREEIFGKEHPSLILTLINLAIICKRGGWINESTKFFEKAVLLCKENYGDNSELLSQIIDSYHAEISSK